MAFRLLITAFFILLISADASQAEPVSAIVTAIGAAIKASLTAAALVKAALAIAVNVGMGLIKQAQAKKAQRKQEPRGTTLSVQFGDTRPLSYVIGTKATAGRRYYAGTWGSAGKTPNAFATDCRVISDLPSYNGPQGLQEAWFGPTKGTILWDQPHPQGWGFPVLEFRSGETDYLWVKYYDGTQTVADPFLLATFGTLAEHLYLPTMIGRGCQLVIYTCRVNETLFPQGFPDALFVPKPMKLYDIRFDTTAGGSGPQRWGDASTYQSSDLLPVMMYNVARGMYYDGKWVHGGRNFASHRLPASSWMAAINEADRAMEEGRKQFRGGLEVFVDEEPLDTLEDMRVGCAGRLAEVGGALKLSVGSPAGAVYSFTDANVVVTSDQGFEPFPSVKSTHNTITSDYPEPKERWKYKDAPEKTLAELLARDGGQKLPVAVRFEAVPFSAQVQSLMTAMIAEEQRWRVHDLVLPPAAIGLEPNDVLSWTSDKQSYGTKRFIAVRVTRLTGSNVRVMMKEIDPSDYNPPAIIIPPVIGWTGTIVAPPQPMTGWTVEPYTVRDTSGRPRRPGIKVKCAPELDDVRNVRVKVRLKSSGALVFDSDATPYGAPHEWIISGQWTLPDTVYQASGLLIAFSNRATEPSEWIDVTTPNVQLIADDVLDGAIVAAKIATAAVIADKIQNEAVTSLKLADLAVTTAKIQIAAVTQDILANSSVIASKIADAAIGITKFASGIEPVGIIAGVTVPATKTTEVITVNGKLYRWNGAAYVASVAAVDMTGQITSTQITDNAITTPKIATNAVTANEIAANAVTSDKLLANSVIAGKIAAGAVSATQIAAAAITADKLAVGMASQWLENTDLAAGMTGWGIRAQSSALQFDPPSIRNDAYGVAPYGAIQIRCNTTAVANQYCDVAPQNADGGIKFFTVEVGKRYQFSAYANAFRATRRLFIGWADSTGVILSYTAGPIINPENTVPQGLLSNYNRMNMFAVAPANAASAVVFVRHNGTVAPNTDSYVWFTHALFGEATDNQTEPSPWSQSGVTLIDAGNIVTGAVTTAKLDALAVTSAKIAAGAIVAGKISAGAITAVDIAASTITGAKIAADTIGVNNLAANSVTAKAMIITDYENLIPNGYFDEANIATYWDLNGAGLNAYTVTGFSQTGLNVLNVQKTIIANSANITLKTAYAIPVTGNEELYAETANMTNSPAAAQGFYFRINWYTAAMVFVSFSDVTSNAPITNSMTMRSNTVTVPSTARYAIIQIISHSTNTTAANLLIDRLVLRRKKAGSLIVDGSITADKLNVNDLSAISATLGSVNISSAIIGSLLVGTSNISPGAVTVFATASNTPAVEFLGLIQLFLTVNHGLGSPTVVLFNTGDFAKKFTDDTGVNIAIGPVNTNNGGYLAVPSGSAFNGVYVTYNYMSTHVPASNVASTQYVINLDGRGYTRNRTTVALVMKR